VERLLRGDFRTDDLTRLFLYVRDRCDGRESVQEIGDFVAHHEEREKGIVTQTTRDWFSIASYLGFLQFNDKQIDLWNLSPEFPEFLAAALRRGSPIVHETTGITRREAQKLLPDVVKNFDVHPTTGMLSVSIRHSWRELKLIEALTTHLVVRSAFDDSRLYDDFCNTLTKLGLLEKKELKSFMRWKPAITLFAVALMHNSVVVMPGGTRIRLIAAAHPGGYIAVSAPIPVPATGLIGADHVRLSSAIFSTSLDATFCEPELLVKPQDWDHDIELTQNIRLGRLG
jgi:hypothetical protein